MKEQIAVVPVFVNEKKAALLKFFIIRPKVGLYVFSIRTCYLHQSSLRSSLARGRPSGFGVKQRLMKFFARIGTSSGILLKSGSVLSIALTRA